MRGTVMRSDRPCRTAGRPVRKLQEMPAKSGRDPLWTTFGRAPVAATLRVETEGKRGLRRGLRQPVLVRQPPDRGAGREELGGVLTPDVVMHGDADPDDARGAGLRGLRLHPGQG